MYAEFDRAAEAIRNIDEMVDDDGALKPAEPRPLALASKDGG